MRARIWHEVQPTPSDLGEVAQSVHPVFRIPPLPVASRWRARRVKLGHVRRRRARRSRVGQGQGG